MKTSLFSFASILLGALFLFCASSTSGPIVVLADESAAAGDDVDEASTEAAIPEEVQPLIDCEEYCMSRLGGVVATCEGTKADMQASILKLSNQLEFNMGLISEKEQDIQRLTAEKEELERHEALFKARINELQGLVAEAQKEAEEASKAGSKSAKTIQDLEDKLVKAGEELQTFIGTRVRVNWDLLKSDGKDLLKKFGLAKGDDEVAMMRLQSHRSGSFW